MAASVTQLNPKGVDQGNQTEALESYTLLQRLNFVEKDLPVIAKSGTNKDQNYKYIEAAAVVSTLRELFAQYGVFLKSELASIDFSEFQSKTGTKGEKVVAWFRFTFINCADKDDAISFEPWAGVAMDYSDKALNKAMTAAQKTFLMKQFLVSDVDPDADSPEAAANHNQQPARPTQPEGQNRPTQPTQQNQGNAAPVPQSNPVPGAPAQPEAKQPNRMPDLTKDEFAGYLKEMGITSGKIAETLSGGKQTTLKDWSEAYKAANPQANIKNWYRFALHEYTAWLVKNNPAAGWLWDKKNQVPQQLEDVPFEETPEVEGVPF